MEVFVEVRIVTKKMDWASGRRIEDKVFLLVDDDVANKLSKVKINDVGKVSRNSKTHTTSYVLYTIGSHYCESGDHSIGQYLYGVKSRTRRVKGSAPNDFTRRAFGITIPQDKKVEDAKELITA